MIATEQQPKIIDIPAGEYFTDHSSISQSMLKVFADRRRLYEGYFVTREISQAADSNPMRKGTALHTAILEPDRFDGMVVTFPADLLASNGAVSTKEAKAFRAEHEAAGRVVLKEADAAKVRSMAESVKRVCGEWLEMPSRKEHSIYWTDEETGLAMKMRLDLLIVGSTPVIFDLKSTADASPFAFKRICETMNYGIQQQQYIDGVQSVMGIAPRFYFIAIEDSHPFACAIYELDEGSVRRERDYRRKLLGDLRDCIETNNWAEPFEQRINTLSLRPRFIENE